MLSDIAKIAGPVADGARLYVSGSNAMAKRFEFDEKKMSAISDREILLRIGKALSMIGESQDQYAFLQAISDFSDRLARIETMLSNLFGSSSMGPSGVGLPAGEIDLGAGPWYVQGNQPSQDPGGTAARISGPFMHTAANWGAPGEPGVFTGQIVAAKQRGGEAWVLNQSKTGSGWYRVTRA